MVRARGLIRVVVGAALCHPLAPFVVRHEGQGKDDEGENGERELHNQWSVVSGTVNQGQWACFMGEDSLRRVCSANRAAKKTAASRIAVSRKPVARSTNEQANGWVRRKRLRSAAMIPGKCSRSHCRATAADWLAEERPWAPAG